MNLNPFSDIPQETPKPQQKKWFTYGAQNTNTPQDTLIDKYKPKIIQDLPHKENAKKLQKWIKQKMDYKKGIEDYVLVIGNTGVGKNEFVRLCFSDLGYNLIEYDETINKHEFEILKESILFTSIEQIFSGESKKGVVIDNCIDNLSNTQLNELLKLLKNNAVSPTVFITSSQSKISDLLKGNGLVLYLDDPSREDILQFALRVVEGEQLDIDVSSLEEYLDGQEYVNYRDILGSLKFLVDGDASRLVKDIELDTLSTLDRFVNPKYGLDFNSSRLASMYTSTLVYDNYLKMVSKDTSMDDLCMIADLVSESDIYKKLMLQDQCWSLNEECNILGTMYTGYIIKRNYKQTVLAKTNIRIYEQLRVEKTFGLDENELKYVISKIYFPLDPSQQWLRKLKKSSRIFYELMEQNYVCDITKALKIFEQSYKLGGKHDLAVVRKIKNKFRTNWKELCK